MHVLFMAQNCQTVFLFEREWNWKGSSRNNLKKLFCLKPLLFLLWWCNWIPLFSIFTICVFAFYVLFKEAKTNNRAAPLLDGKSQMFSICHLKKNIFFFTCETNLKNPKLFFLNGRAINFSLISITYAECRDFLLFT